MKITPADKERFFKYVLKDPETGCWWWLGCCHYKGHGQFWMPGIGKKRKRGAMAYAHRISYLLHNGPIPLGKVIDHKCENKHCVNPDHLEAITSIENTLRSCESKGWDSPAYDIEEAEYNEYAKAVIGG